MQEENAQATDELAPLRPAHAVDFLGDMLDVGLSQFSRSQEFGLLAAPGEEVTLVKDALHGHWARVRRSAFSVYRSGVPSRFRHSRGNTARMGPRSGTKIRSRRGLVSQLPRSGSSAINSTFSVDSELSCPVLVAHHLSASSGFVLPVGGVGKPEACPCRPQGRAAERI